MDIQKKDSYRIMIFAVLLILVSGLNTFGQDKSPLQVLMDSYKLPEKLTEEIAKNKISELNQSLVSCTDQTLRFRIEYRIGTIYFKTGDLSKAVGCFENINQTNDCSEIIKLCSFNMTGQIYRMLAKDDKALEAFEKVIELSKKIIDKNPNQEHPASLLKLSATARFGRAEIYQYNQNYKSASAEYKKIVILLKNNEQLAKTYVPLAIDRLSQLYLIEGEVKDYNKAATKLIKKYSDYYRTPIVKLEAESVKILKEKDSSVNFTKGSFDAPARLIGLSKDSSDKELKDKIEVLLEDLSSKYKQGYGGILISYHYAWFLDALGQQKQAAKLLENILQQTKSINPDAPPYINSTIHTLTDYTKLQQAVILGEENKYKEAIEIVSLLKPDPNDVHITTLAESIEYALQTLKREVPKDANNQ